MNDKEIESWRKRGVVKNRGHFIIKNPCEVEPLENGDRVQFVHGKPICGYVSTKDKKFNKAVIAAFGGKEDKNSGIPDLSNILWMDGKGLQAMVLEGDTIEHYCAGVAYDFYRVAIYKL